MQPPDVSGWPFGYQVAIYAAVFITTVGLILNYYLRGRTAPKPVESKDMILSAATIADMGPVREMARCMGEISATWREMQPDMREIKDSLKDLAKEAEFRNRQGPR